MAINNHQISMKLEMAGRKALNLQERGGLYGVIDADYIDRVGNAFTVLVASLAPYYKDGDSGTQQKINDFLEKYDYLGDADGSRDDYAEGVDEAASELRRLIDELNS